MNARYPIYTAATECQDCYKCIRGCPVKAIKVERGYASVESNRCSTGALVSVFTNEYSMVAEGACFLSSTWRL